MKLKTLFKTLIATQVRRAFRSLSAAKSKTLQLIHSPIIISKKQRSKKRHTNNNKNNKIFIGSFRFHYNWCSSKRHSHVLPVPAPVFDGLPSNPTSFSYYDATWHSTIPTTHDHNNNNSINNANANANSNNNLNNSHHESQLYGYLEWLEEKRVHGKAYGGENRNTDDDIDTLADMFIANCHAKFILEKQESARRFKEMLERSA